MRIKGVANHAQLGHHEARVHIGFRIMAVSNYASAPKKATNVSIAEDLIREAKALRVNVSQAAEAGLAHAVAEKRSERWRQENREAIESSNAFVDEHGLPLARHRMF